MHLSAVATNVVRVPRNSNLLSQDEEGEEFKCVGKFVYLCSRIFSSEGEEEKKYEISRIGKIFNLPPNQWTNRVANVAAPFYTRALTSAKNKEEVGADMLRRARTQIGIRETDGVQMHEDTYSQVRNYEGQSDEL